MSDSEEDFASADEGDVDNTKDDTSKKVNEDQPLKSSDSDHVKKSNKQDANKASSKKGDGDSNSSVNTKTEKKPNKKNTEKSSIQPDKTHGNEETGATGETKSQTDKGKKKKQKGGKGKRVGQKESQDHGESVTEKQIDGKDSDAVTKTVDKEEDSKKDNQDQELSSWSSGVKEKDKRTREEKSPEKSECKESTSDEDKTQDKERDTTKQCVPLQQNEKENTPLKGNKGITNTTGENLTVDQKAAMLKSPSSQSISRPDPDHTPQQEEVLEKLSSSAKEKKSGWGWGWGSSLLEVASTSVSTFSHQVGEGLHTMMETVESTLNVPNPEELALRRTAEKDAEPEKADSDQGSEEISEKSSSKTGEGNQSTDGDNQSSQVSGKAETQSVGGWFSGWGVSNITKKIESTGKHLVTGGLDVLESLGKKTFDVINEHDPGLKKARAFLHDRGDKPNLSAVLREAKEQQEARLRQEKETEEARKAHFGSLFDDFQGLAHLEALEMLSNQSEKRVNTLLQALPPEAIAKLKPQLLQIKTNFEIDDDDDEDVSEQEFELLVRDLLKQLNVGTSADKIVKAHAGIEEKLLECCDNEKKTDIKDIHQVAISSLAEYTSKCIEQFHKAGELLLIQKNPVPDFKECSSLLQRFTKVLAAEVGILSTKFSDCLNKHEGDGEIKVNHLVTNIYLEASNSSSYIQDGFRLLLPVLQQATIESSQEPAN